MNHSTSKPKKEEQQRLDLLSRLPCICCYPIVQPNRTEIHHLVDFGYRVHSGGHMATLPLCAWHHRGVPRYGYQRSHMATVYGPSLALSKRTFIETYGTERELLQRVDQFVSTASVEHLHIVLAPSASVPWPGLSTHSGDEPV
jgi:hypothetical protein